jgi:hypothetical protein
MSRSAAATSAGRTRTHRRAAAPPAPRRVSGPAAPPRGDRDGSRSRPPRARIDASALAYADGAAVERYGTLPVRRARAYAAPRPRRLAYGGVAVASRVAGVALDVSASRFMDRVVRGRVWIGVIAVSLFGLVAMQVSMLKLNSGIGRAVQTVGTLERRNSSLRSDITRLSAGERIQPLAEAQGFVMPAPADVAYLRAGDRHADAVRAARRMRAPDAATAGFAGSAITPELGAGVTPPSGLAGATTAGAGTTAPAPATTTGTAPGATTPAAPATATTDPATGAATAAPQQTAPATTATTPPAAAQPGAQPAAQAPTAAVSGGAAPPTTIP